MKKLFIFLFLFLILILILAVFLWQGVYLPRDKYISEQRIFIIEKGESVFTISKNLEKEDLIKNKIFFTAYIILQGKSKMLKAGEYQLSPSMDIPEIAQKIISGRVIKNIITIPEGWNLRDIGWHFENRGMFQAEELFELAGFPAVDYSKDTDLPLPKDFSNDYDFLKDKPKNVGLEGYLFPDTYEVNRGEELETIVRKMLDNFDRKLAPHRNEVSGAGLTPELRAEITSQGKTIFEIITMASLLEREVKTKEDKEIVAGILWKRLKNNIPLQVDATITYITGKKTINPEGEGAWRPYGARISIEETQIDSVYNTYQYAGLPLGPICNPGLESILTAIYPEDSDFWYYLSAPETGETIFSKTLEEHNIAKEKYLKPR